MPTSLDDKNKWEVALTKVNLSIIKQFEAMFEVSKGTVKYFKETWAEEIRADTDITVCAELIDRLIGHEAEFLKYLRMEILESNQNSLEIRRLGAPRRGSARRRVDRWRGALACPGTNVIA